MLIIKRINGEVKYAYDATAKKITQERQDDVILIPKIGPSSNQQSLWCWYKNNYQVLDTIIDMYLNVLTQFVLQHRKYAVVFDDDIFRTHLLYKLYKTSLNTRKW